MQELNDTEFLSPYSWKEKVEYDTSLSWPKISIITPSFNQGKFIEETILSVLRQGYPNLEYVIFDGGSSDTTVEIIRKYESEISYWESVPDKGQSDAINKGLKYVTGDIINWLNSDDYLTQGALKKIAKNFMENPGLKMLGGRSRIFDEKGKSVLSDTTYCNKDSLNDTIATLHIEQPATYFSSDAFRAITPLRHDFHYIMDKEMLLRFYLNYSLSELTLTNDVFVNFRLHDNSKTTSLDKKFIDEHATLIYEIAILNTKFVKYSDFLKRHFHLVKFEPIPYLNKLSEDTASFMILSFLIKYTSRIFERKDFDKAVELIGIIKENNMTGHPGYRLLSEKSCHGSWFLFRLRRKWNYLRNRLLWKK